MQSEYGKIHWDFATSLNTFNETYLIAPVLKDNRVVAYVEAKRIDSKVFFQFTTNDEKTNSFFKTLLFTEKEKLKATDNPSQPTNTDEILYSTNSTRVLECKTVTKTHIVGEVEGGGNNQGGDMEATYTETICKFVDGPLEISECIGEYDAQGNCTGGAGSPGGGYYYPNPEEEELEQDCEKAKQNINDPRFKQKFKELNTQSNLDGINEKGIFERAAPVGSNLQSSFIPISNQSCTTHMPLPQNKDGIYGLFHIHNNINCKNDKVNVKAPSPVDLRTFFHILMKQANHIKEAIQKHILSLLLAMEVLC